MMAWWAAFVWTLVSELPVFAWGLRACARTWWEPVVVTCAVNLATHPAFGLWCAWAKPTAAAVWVAEVLIAVGEGLLVAQWLRPRLGLGRAMALAAMANAGSVAFGWLVLGA